MWGASFLGHPSVRSHLASRPSMQAHSRTNLGRRVGSGHLPYVCLVEAAITMEGERDGTSGFIVDPFGHGWTIATHVEDVSRDEMGRRMAALFG